MYYHIHHLKTVGFISIDINSTTVLNSSDLLLVISYLKDQGDKDIRNKYSGLVVRTK